MAKLAMYFETAAGEKKVVKVENVKWAYPSGSDYFIEWFDERMKSWKQAEISESTYNAIDQLVTVTAQNYADAPITGSMKINPHAVTLANNVGGLDQEILSADQLAFVEDTGDWVITNDANAGTFSTDAGVANVVGVASPTTADDSTLVTTVAVVEDEVYTFEVEVGSVDLDGAELGTDFDLSISVGATSVDLTDADVTEGNVITINHTASATGNINITFTFTGIIEADQSGVTIDFVSPTIRRQTGSTQLVGVLDGTLVRYEVAQQPLALLLTNGVSALVTASDSALVSFVPTGVNGGDWNGGTPAAVAFQKVNIINELESGVAIIDLNAKSSSLLVKTSTALTSLDS